LHKKNYGLGWLCTKGKTSLFCFSEIMDARLYVDIVRRHIPEISQMLGDDWQSNKTTILNIPAELPNHFSVIMYPS